MDNPKEIAIKQEGMTLMKTANQIIISSVDTLREGNNFFLACKRLEKQIIDFFAPMKKAASLAHREICDREKEALRPVMDARNNIDWKILEYRKVEKAKAAEQQRLADLERARQEKTEQDKFLTKAAKASEKGQEEKAAELLEKAEQVFIPPTIIAPTVSKTEIADLGAVTSRKDWEVQVVDKMKVIRAVAEGILPHTILEVREMPIKLWAKAQGIDQYADNGLVVQKGEALVARQAKEK
jgi:hypothetical protein